MSSSAAMGLILRASNIYILKYYVSFDGHITRRWRLFTLYALFMFMLRGRYIRDRSAGFLKAYPRVT